MHKDQYFTPSKVAHKMVSNTTVMSPAIIADFAAGDGSLLKASKSLWPESKLIAVDICKETVEALKNEEESWFVESCDFLAEPQRIASPLLASVTGRCSLVLLNPPFSCRGGTVWECQHQNKTIRCGLALAFLITALPFLSPDGEMIAIIPKGCLTNEKDRDAVNFLASLGHWSVLWVNPHDTFSGCSAHTVIVRLSLGRGASSVQVTDDKMSISRTRNTIAASISRGRTSMYLLPEHLVESGIPFVHSTDLGQDFDVSRLRSVSDKIPQITGPAVLISRVGRPNKQKVVLYEGSTPIAMSDCVIAVTCRNKKEAKETKRVIIDNWEMIEERYTGTCAQHLTLKTLSRLLTAMGLNVNVV